MFELVEIEEVLVSEGDDEWPVDVVNDDELQWVLDGEA